MQRARTLRIWGDGLRTSVLPWCDNYRITVTGLWRHGLSVAAAWLPGGGGGVVPPWWRRHSDETAPRAAAGPTGPNRRATSFRQDAHRMRAESGQNPGRRRSDRGAAGKLCRQQPLRSTVFVRAL